MHACSCPPLLGDVVPSGSLASQDRPTLLTDPDTTAPVCTCRLVGCCGLMAQHGRPPWRPDASCAGAELAQRVPVAVEEEVAVQEVGALLNYVISRQ